VPPQSDTPQQRMSQGEFVALVAMMFSIIAFSVDSLLPAYPMIAAELRAENSVHLLITIFIAGLAVGTLIAGPMSDAIGRKPTVFLGSALFIGSGLVAWQAQSFEVLLAARAVQGLGAAGPRVVSLAMVRDLYKGNQMARILSFAMIIFTLVPTFAPALAAFLQDVFGWRFILLMLTVFAATTLTWLTLRFVESLPPHARRPFKLRELSEATREVFGHPVVRLAVFAQTAAMGIIFGLIVQLQPIYDVTYGRAESFPYWLGAIALGSAASTSLANAVLVERLGMRFMVTVGLVGQVVCATVAALAIWQMPQIGFWVFVVWQFMVIWLTGLCIGNLNAIAMEPMGHIAGFTASITGAVSTLGAAIVASLVGQIFDGTAVPLILCIGILGMLGLLAVVRMGPQPVEQT